MPPKITKPQRHLTRANTATTSSGVNAPPQRAASHMMPCARTRSPDGSHSVNAFVKFGKQPASPAPNKNRQTTRDTKFQTQPVAAVNTDHMATTRINTLRGPIQSPSQPPGSRRRRRRR